MAGHGLCFGIEYKHAPVIDLIKIQFQAVFKGQIHSIRTDACSIAFDFEVAKNRAIYFTQLAFIIFHRNSGWRTYFFWYTAKLLINRYKYTHTILPAGAILRSQFPRADRYCERLKNNFPAKNNKEKRNKGSRLTAYSDSAL